MMDFTKLFVGGALIGTLITFWNQFKSIIWKICTIILKKVNLEKDLSSEVLNYLKENYKYIYLHDRSYHISDAVLKKDSRYQKVGWENFENCSIVFFNGKVPFYLNKYIDTTKNDKGTIEIKIGCTIYYIRGLLDVDNIIYGAICRINKLKSQIFQTTNNTNRFFIKYIPGIRKSEDFDINYDFTSNINRCITNNLEELGLTVKKDGLNKIILTKENQDIIKLADLWKNNKKWYNDKDIPWKMGWLLHGPPGTGKTILSRRIAEHLNMPLFIYKLGLLNDCEFSEEWFKMQSNTPCVALIEDFDNVFHGRESVVSVDMFMERLSLLEDKPKEYNEDEHRKRYGKRLSFDNLLNTLDGAERYEGILTIITTNHIDKIDPSLLDRPGRIDKVIELTYLTEENKVIMIDKFLSDMPIVKNKALEYIKINKDEKITPAQMQEICTSLALKEFLQC